MRALAAVAGLSLALWGCSVDVEGAPCMDNSTCPSDQGCGLDGRCSYAAACPAPGSDIGQGCSDLPAVQSCSASGQYRMNCGSFALTLEPSCTAWKAIEDCQTSAPLSCAAVSGITTCDCKVGEPILYVDPTVTNLPAGKTRSGAHFPDYCRFLTLGAALSVAPSAPQVRLAGFVAGGSQVVASETGPLVVEAGVAVTTEDATPNPANYALSAGGNGTAFLSIKAGSRISGIEIGTAGFTGDAIVTSCPGAGDTAMVTIDAVKITGTGSGASPPKFKSGIHQVGHCSLVVLDSQVSGVRDTGVFLDSISSPTATDLRRNTITGNDSTDPAMQFLIGTTVRKAGGILITGALPAMTFQANRLQCNKGDQMLVAVSGGTLDLRGGTACDASSNLITGYDAGYAGLAAPDATGARVDFTYFRHQPAASGTSDFAGNGVLGGNLACGDTIVTCP